MFWDVRRSSSCCVGSELGEHSEAFHKLFLPSVVNGLLSLAGQLMMRPEVRGVLDQMVMICVTLVVTDHLSISVCPTSGR